MAEQQPGGGYGGGRSWLKYLLIYLVIGGIAYAVIYYAFLSNGDGGYGG